MATHTQFEVYNIHLSSNFPFVYFYVFSVYLFFATKELIVVTALELINIRLHNAEAEATL